LLRAVLLQLLYWRAIHAGRSTSLRSQRVFLTSSPLTMDADGTKTMIDLEVSGARPEMRSDEQRQKGQNRCSIRATRRSPD
jgi:hypothetical protein